MLDLDLTLRPLPARTCRLRVGRGALARLADELVEAPPGRPLVLVSDSNVAPLHAAPLADLLRGRGLHVETLVFPAGEANKTRAVKAEIEDGLYDLGAGRDCALVGVGGGVVCDLAGFVAATWQRGVPVVQVPTSLLAMADAAIGGKTGVNVPGGKNLVGAFHQPWGVYADVDTLHTLPEPRFREGLAEVVKSAAIADAALFRWLEASLAAVLVREPTALEHAVAGAARVKASVVRRDEREAGRREMLNFGHTVAHAIETTTAYAESHGRAVAIGMCLEARLALAATGFPASHRRRLRDLLEACGLPTRLPEGIDLQALVVATRRDKKARGGRARFALPRRIGRMPSGGSVSIEVAESDLRLALAAER